MQTTHQISNANPGEARIPGSQLSGEPQAVPPTEGLAVAPAAAVKKSLTVAPAANENDSANLLRRLAEAEENGEAEIVQLIGRVLFQKAVINQMRNAGLRRLA